MYIPHIYRENPFHIYILHRLTEITFDKQFYKSIHIKGLFLANRVRYNQAIKYINVKDI